MSEPKVKRQVGKYELGQTIGEGTFAKVRLARNMETGEHVAIKIIFKEKVLKHKLVEQVSFIFLEPFQVDKFAQWFQSVCSFFFLLSIILSLFWSVLRNLKI